jgi:glycosyltransferase involved in cell wall biosynthesis
MLSIILPSHREPEIHRFVDRVAERFPACEIIVSSDSEGRGKGWAIRQAIAHARGEEIAFLDGDGDIHPRMLLRLVPFLEDFDVVVGTKRINHRHLSRRVITTLSRIYIRTIFGLTCDTQTGIKLFRRAAIMDWKTDGFLFDVEILANAQKNGCRIVEVPIEAEITERMSRRAVWKTFLESLTLKFRLLFLAGR